MNAVASLVVDEMYFPPLTAYSWREMDILSLSCLSNRTTQSAFVRSCALKPEGTISLRVDPGYENRGAWRTQMEILDIRRFVTPIDIRENTFEENTLYSSSSASRRAYGHEEGDSCSSTLSVSLSVCERLCSCL